MTARPDAATRGPGLPHTLTEWLRGYSDAELVALLRRRPDLALPAPVDLATLASRASVRTSLSRAVDSLDAFTLRVLETAACLGPFCAEADIASWFPAATRPAVSNAVEELRRWLLLWGDDARLHLVGAVRETLGPYPAGLGRPAADLFAKVNDLALAPLLRSLGLAPATQPASGAAVAATILHGLDAMLAACADDELALLRRLAAGPPAGVVRESLTPADSDASSNGNGNRNGMLRPRPAPGQPPDETAAVVRRLVDRGLLVVTDVRTVELPREIALELREHPAGDVEPEPPPLAATEPGAAVIDGGAATAVLETVRLVELLLTAIADGPPGQLRSGGLGVRDLRRLSRVLDVSESLTALLLEAAAAAGLLSSVAGESSFLPTTDFDDWLSATTAQRWARLAGAWLGMTRQPSLVGQRDERDKAIAPLSAEVERHTAPGLRLTVLGLLADLPPGSAPAGDDEVLVRLNWLAPRRASANRASAAAVLTEAAALGVTGHGAVTGYARALLDGAETGADRAGANAVDALDAALPAAVSEFLLQPDLTAVVPGPPTPQLQRELSLAADLESSGGASVFRISPSSIRRALDAGRTGADLRRFFATNSRTPVPQALDYLIGDVATQHGRLRAGVATSYLRCDDETLLDQVLAACEPSDLRLRRLAPTVAISSSGISALLDRLRQHGFAPAAEAADGAVVSLAADAPRAPARPHSRIARVRPSGLPDNQLAEVVKRLRASERLAYAVTRSANRVTQQIPGVTSASILELLRTAVREERAIAMGYVDDTGTPSQRTLLPISVGGGMIRGHAPDELRGVADTSVLKLHSYPLQRITTVSLLDDDVDAPQ